VITFTYLFPHAITAGTVTQLASSRPFNATPASTTTETARTTTVP
jgi:hypothetical protein